MSRLSVERAVVRRKRVRRTNEVAKRQILNAAEKLLRDGGEGAVTVRAVATAVGVTDAAINHHFGGRQDLLIALLRHGGRLLKDRLNATIERWRRSDDRIEPLIEALYDLYADGTYASLALHLHLTGWRDTGAGMLSPAVECIHRMRCEVHVRFGKRRPPIGETQFVVAWIHQTLSLDPLFGEAFRRSAGTACPQRQTPAARKRLWVRLLSRALLTPPEFDRCAPAGR